ncbi:MAG: DUF4351 domain-containing protein [Polyangiaceae bacterium]|nr:DUF4351 domain-containing protein [Polyangiaceae bacterium]
MERRSKPTPAPFPPVDEHIVVPEVSRVELIDGREVIDVGSLSPHADAQALTGFLLAAHVLREFVVATELLTRSSVESDFATDVCIRKRGIDPETGSRYLEELSFEIVNEQSMSDVTGKAKNLARRGVRRIFAIFVKSGEIREWSKSSGEFTRLDMNAMFDDPVFVRPIAVKALVDSTLAEAENEVAKALIAKKNPEIAKLQQEAEQHGHKKGLDEGHKKGLDEGHKKGLDEGHKKGLDEGHKKGLDEGHKKGLDEGHKKGLDEGHKKGLDEGHKKGLDIGRNMLRRLLRQRFGDVPASVGSRVDTATAEQLERWTAQLFSVASIEELFASDSAM